MSANPIATLVDLIFEGHVSPSDNQDICPLWYPMEREIIESDIDKKGMAVSTG